MDPAPFHIPGSIGKLGEEDEVPPDGTDIAGVGAVIQVHFRDNVAFTCRSLQIPKRLRL